MSELETTIENAVTIRPVANSEEMALVHRLTHDLYVSQGYVTPQPGGRLIHYADFDGLPETTVLVAIRDNELIGSISLTLDGPWGLTVDKDFRDVCDVLRYSGRSLAVVWRLVINDKTSPSRRILMALFQETIDLTARLGANTSLFAVNPKHKAAYRRLLNASEVSIKGGTKGLANAPAVLIRYDYERLPQHWRRLDKVESIPQAA